MTLKTRIWRGRVRALLLPAFMTCLLVLPASAQTTSIQSPPDDIARNANPAESDNGWGGGANKAEITDGVRTYPEWYHGLAFCGGTGQWCGQTCGWHQATIDFGAPRSFNRVVAWHHGMEHVPNTCRIESWNGSGWTVVFSTTTGHDYLLPVNFPPGYYGSDPTENTFPTVTSSKVRFALNNCDITHGWLYEIEVYNDAPAAAVLVASAPSGVEIYPGDRVPVRLDIQNASGLYAAQARCTVDASVLQPQAAAFGDLFDPSRRLIGANQIDAAMGTWLGGISLRSPAVPLSGSGVLANLDYQAQAPGTTSMSCVPTLVDRDGGDLASTFSGPALTVVAFATIDGTAHYQGRGAHGGIEVTAVGPVTQSATTGSAGAFRIERLRRGNYDVRADAARYLPACTTASLTPGQGLSLTAATLRGGDANDDSVIDIGDATLVAGQFGLAVPPADARADINDDSVVDIRDLAILGGNYGLQGCQGW